MKTENMDQWTDQESVIQFAETARAIVEAGYTGIKLVPINHDQATSKFDWTIAYDASCPEGLLINVLMELAKKGKALPTSDALSILDRIYCDQGLTHSQKITNSKSGAM